MENRTSLANGNANTDEILSRKARGREFFARYLLRRSTGPEEGSLLSSIETDDDDDEEESTTTQKKRKKIFSKLFRRNVEAPYSPKEAAPKNEYSFYPDKWFNWKAPTESVTEEVERSTSNDINYAEVGNRESLSVANDPDHGVVSETRRVEDVPAEYEGHTKEAINDQLPQVDSSTEQHERIDRHDDGATGLLVIDHDSDARNHSQETGAKHPERIVERRGSVLPYLLVGAEHFARKSADKKLDKKHTSIASKMESKISAQSQKSSELESLIARNQEQLQMLKQQAEYRELRQNEMQSKEYTPVKADVPRQERQVLVASERQEPQSRQVFESVANAAEHDIPVERAFERSHEVKDDQPSSRVSGASSVGDVARVQLGHMGTAADPYANYRVNVPVESAAMDPEVIRATYVQAMKMGFIAGIVVIGLGILGYLMVK